ncbi:hypothetical protein CT106_01675 [Salmonella enterica subsp. enterica serovar Norwich]|nr:hypothetical protein [Salmonella enterica]EAS4416641.1 hypothetical protein [Salmonella enterica]EBM6034715.1 hypothetical protein [Salmonella enterica]MIQ01328.1 hypothetical protein [Salmonella enterica subsp. enterica serovar Norwich]
MGQKFFDMHESSRLNMSFNCSGAFNIIYIMRTIIAEGEKQPPSVNQSYNQRPALADAESGGRMFASIRFPGYRSTR